MKRIFLLILVFLWPAMAWAQMTDDGTYVHPTTTNRGLSVNGPLGETGTAAGFHCDASGNCSVNNLTVGGTFQVTAPATGAASLYVEENDDGVTPVACSNLASGDSVQRLRIADVNNAASTEQWAICAGTTQVVSDITLLSTFGTAVNANEMAAEDFGDWSCTGLAGGCTVDANAIPLGTDTTGNYVGTITAGSGLATTGASSGEGIAHSLSTDSTSAGFLASGALTCGAGTAGKAQVHTTPLQYCDNAATPALQYAAYGDSSGNATGVAAGTVSGGTGGAITDGTVDGEDMAASYAGRSLTETAGSPDVLDADPELYTEEAHFDILAGTMTAGQELLMRASGGALTIVRLDCIGTGGSTPTTTYTVVECNTGGASCATTGFAASLSALGTNVADTTGTDTAIAQGNYWGLEATTLTTEPDIATCTIEYTRDD